MDGLRRHACSIWNAAVEAVRADRLVQQAVTTSESAVATSLAAARRIIVVGGGKAGAAMAAGLEAGMPDRLDRVTGIVNIPAGTERDLSAIRRNVARPAGINEPTEAGVVGVEEMLRLVAQATADDVVICLLSGGGSALLPLPADGLTLGDKQHVTRLLHASGATIVEMNAVRKHLSRIKGGGLARACTGARLYCLILSDVIGDPLDVIASGPTVEDSTTFADALNVLRRYNLLDRVPTTVRISLEQGSTGVYPETLKEKPKNVENIIVGNNALALAAGRQRAEALGYQVLDLGSTVEGETKQVAQSAVELVRRIVDDKSPVAPPACVLIGGETTVTLAENHGKGGRNTEFVLAALLALERAGLRHVVVLSGGTDGEDGPTDAAGAVGQVSSLTKARIAGIDPGQMLARHDSYTFFRATGDLLVTGPTNTNVMDVRLFIVPTEIS